VSDSFNLVKVFSARKRTSLDELGDRVSSWMKAHPKARVVKVVVVQSSDLKVHCLSMVLLCREDA
jgi:hypothetical protein